jgi:arsenite methyltransferase
VQDECPSNERAGELRRAVMDKYRLVVTNPEGRFPYPVGRASALGLGYEPEWLDAAPREVVARFVGVGNPFAVCHPGAGDRVLDIGCGCGLDVFVSGHLAGPGGHAVGIDMTPGMIEVPRGLVGAGPFANLEFRVADAENLPFDGGTFDVVISNGALNLVPDKDRAFREIHRVLRGGGTFATADLLVTETVPQSILEDMDAWST